MKNAQVASPQVLAVLCRQALAPFGTPRIDHFTTATGRHASPETVIAFPLDDAWLKGPLHVGPIGKRSAILWAVLGGVNLSCVSPRAFR